MTLVSINYIFKAFIEGAVAFISKGGTVIFINKGSLAIKEKLFKIAKAKVNRYNLRQRLIIYKLKSPLVLMNSLISLFNYFIWLFS